MLKREVCGRDEEQGTAMPPSLCSNSAAENGLRARVGAGQVEGLVPAALVTVTKNTHQRGRAR